MFGFELTTDYYLNDTWQMGGYITLSEAEYTDYCSIQAPQYTYIAGMAPVIPILTPEDDNVLSSCGIVNGNSLTQHSPFTANLNVRAQLPEFGSFSTSVRLDIQHKAKHYEDHLNLLERADVTTANISANMRSENFTIRLFVNNLTDNDDPFRVSIGRDFRDNANPTLPATAIHTWGISGARPREVGLQLDYNF